MRFLPVAMREAMVVSRSRAAYHGRWLVVGVGLVSILFAVSADSSDAVGKNIFTIVATEAFIFCAVAGALLTYDTIALEKRQETLGLLLLTPLRPFDVLAGKAVAAAGKSFFGVLAFLPMIALPILIGGVGVLQYSFVAINLLATLLLSLSMGILISSVFKSSIVTTTLGFLAPAVIVFGPMAAKAIFEMIYNLDPPIQWASPFYGHAVALDQFGISGTVHSVTCSIAIIFLWACFNLYWAGAFLKRSCKNVPTPRSEKASQAVRKMRFGGERARTKLRTVLLDQNPLAWLANREQVSSSGLMAALLIVLLAGIAFEYRPGEEYSLVNLFDDWPVLLLLMHGTLIFRMVTAACGQLAEDRRTGALELLLSTRLSVDEILRGRSKALVRQFFGPVAIVAFCHLCGLILSAIKISVNPSPEPWENDARFVLVMWIGLGVIFPLAWRAIGYVGAWQGLRRRNAAVAAVSAFGTLLGWPFLVFILLALAGFAAGAPFDSQRAFWEGINVVLGIFTAGFLFTLGNLARAEVRQKFRSLAFGTPGKN